MLSWHKGSLIYTHIYKYVKNSIRCGQTKNKGKIHGEEYWMVKYYQSLFPNVQMLAMLPVFESQRCSQSKRRKETL